MLPKLYIKRKQRFKDKQLKNLFPKVLYLMRNRPSIQVLRIIEQQDTGLEPSAIKQISKSSQL